MQKIETELAKVADLKTKQNEPPKKKPETRKESKQVAQLEPPKSSLSESSEKRTGTKALDVSFKKGLAFFKAGDFKEAKLKFNRVSETAANYLQVTEYLQKINSAEKQVKDGLTSFFEGNNTQSIKLLKRSLDRLPDKSECSGLFGLCLCHRIFFIW